MSDNREQPLDQKGEMVRFAFEFETPLETDPEEVLQRLAEMLAQHGVALTMPCHEGYDASILAPIREGIPADQKRASSAVISMRIKEGPTVARIVAEAAATLLAEHQEEFQAVIDTGEASESFLRMCEHNPVYQDAIVRVATAQFETFGGISEGLHRIKDALVSEEQSASLAAKSSKRLYGEGV